MDRYQERLLNVLKQLGDTLLRLEQTLQSGFQTFAEARVICAPASSPEPETFFDHRPIGQILLEQERENDQST